MIERLHRLAAVFGLAMALLLTAASTLQGTETSDAQTVAGSQVRTVSDKVPSMADASDRSNRARQPDAAAARIGPSRTYLIVLGTAALVLTGYMMTTPRGGSAR